MIKNVSGSKLLHEETSTYDNIGSKGDTDEEVLRGNNQENFDLSTSPDEAMVDIFSNEFAKSVSNNTKEATKSKKMVDISVSGPFQNRLSGYSYWSVIYGDQEAWFLKSHFMNGFVKSVMTSLKFSSEVTVHCASYRGINIRKVEFGEECVTKRNGQVKTIPRLSFVFGKKTSDEGTGLEVLRNVLDKVFWCLKARKHNPIGALI